MIGVRRMPAASTGRHGRWIMERGWMFGILMALHEQASERESIAMAFGIDGTAESLFGKLFASH